jgi:hypothetical protein
MENFLLIGVFLSILIYLTYPIPGIYLSRQIMGDVHIVSFINIFIVFFISDITLKMREILSL